MGARTQCRVAADSRRSTDLIQAIRVPVGRGVVAAAVGAGWARPDVPARPGPGGVAGRFGSWERRYLYLSCATVVHLDRLGDLSLIGSVESRRFRLVTPIPALGSGSTLSMPEWLQVPPGTRPWIPGDISHQI